MIRKPIVSVESSQPTLLDHVEVYISERSLCHAYKSNLRKYVGLYVQWAGRADLGILNCRMANKWLDSLTCSPHTRDNYRRNLLAVWNWLYMAELVEEPPLRLKKVKKPRCVPQAWNHDQIAKLLDVAEGLKGLQVNGNSRADFWAGIIHAGYSTGLRRGDLLRLQWPAIQADGSATIVQHKTGYPITVRLSPEALQFAGRLNHFSGLCFPWPFHLTYFQIWFKELVKRAGLQSGTFRWLRRSAGSYAESVQRGNGAAALGHRSEGVFRTHYDDPSISKPTPIIVPALKRPAVG